MDTLQERVLQETEFLGIAYTSVPEEYQGACRLEVEHRSKSAAVFPSEHEANSAASFAIGILGGYSIARVTPAPGFAPTHPDWRAWAFD
jgi:hypothetical protein